MKYVLTAKEVADVERAAISSGRIDEETLRKNAAHCLAQYIAKVAPNKSVAVVCGGGGNGADGVLAACELKRGGANVAIYSIDAKLSKVAPTLDIARQTGVPIKNAAPGEIRADVIVDAIYGIGLNRNVTGLVARIISGLNTENALRIATDIPSGLNPDSGEIMGEAFHADATVTFSCYKRGMLFGSGRNMCGIMTVFDVGVGTLPETAMRVFEDADFKPIRRQPDGHKGNFGRVYIIGGCATMVGAPLLAGAAAHAAFLNGAGLVTICVPKINAVAIAARAVMQTLDFLPDTIDGFMRFDAGKLDEIISRADAIDIGMGMGAAPDLKDIVRYISANFDGKLVIDADGLNSIVKDYAFLKDSRADIVITPHAGEFVRLTGLDPTPENAKRLAGELGITAVVKSATTVITDGGDVRVNLAGTPALAKGGSGDVLGGCIAALCKTFKPIDAATIACYRNGTGAVNAVSSYAELMLTPRDVLNFAAYKELY